MHSKVDPAALLVAVFAAALVPLTQPGVWDVTGTYIAAIVGVVVVCFTWPRVDDQGRAPEFDRRTVLAQSVVYGFILGIALCWPVQSLLSGCWLLRTDVTCDLGEHTGVHATFIAFGTGVLSTFVIYLLVRWKIKRLQQPPSEPQTVEKAPGEVRRQEVGGSTSVSPPQRHDQPDDPSAEPRRRDIAATNEDEPRQ
jgi:hypothetical protein